MPSTNNDLEQHLKERNIDTLYHFTNVKNLRNITQNGIKPRSELKFNEASINDENRYDCRTDTVSLSSGHPQQKMLSRCRRDNPDEFAIIEIDAKVLVEGGGKVFFCPHNAACKEMSSSSDEKLSNINSFDEMFDDPSETRISEKLSEQDPTDVQAEILYSGIIERKYMRHIQFTTRQKKKAYKTDLDGISSSIADPKYGLYAARETRRSLGIK